MPVQRSEEETSRQAQREAWAKEWKDAFWSSLKAIDKFIDQDIAFLQWGFEDYAAQFKEAGYPPSGQPSSFFEHEEDDRSYPFRPSFF